MANIEESEKRLWEYMSLHPPGAWNQDHWTLLFDYGRRRAIARRHKKAYVDDIALILIRKVVECPWWREPGHDVGNPDAFRKYVATVYRTAETDLYRGNVRYAKRHESIEAADEDEEIRVTGRSRLEPAETHPDFNPEASLGHTHIDSDAINKIHQALTDFIGALGGEVLETFRFLRDCTKISLGLGEPDGNYNHFLAEFVGILSGSVRPGDFIEALMDAYPDLNRNQARKRIQRVQKAFRPFREKLRDEL